MENLITYDKIKILECSLSSSIGIWLRQKLWILVNFQKSQLFEKSLKAQHHLIQSSYKIQKEYTILMDYKTDDIRINEADIEKLIRININYELLSAIQEYYSLKEYLQNLLLSLFVDKVVYKSRKKDDIIIIDVNISNEFEYILYTLKDEKFNSETGLLKEVNSKINERFSFKNNESKESRKEINKILGLLLKSYNLWSDYENICKFFSRPEVKNVFYANEIKHYFVPLGTKNLKFNVSHYLDLKKNIRITIGDFERIDLDICKTQKLLIEFNNLFVDFVNSYFEKYKF